jgi:N-acetylglucosamine malate deacetylase 1
VDMLHCHVSQFYEWLPYNGGYADQVPEGDVVRREWLKEWMQRRLRPLADRHRDRVVQTYGVVQGHQIEYIEAFEVSEYGSPLDDAARAQLFPFLPTVTPLSGTAPVEDWSDLRDDE